MFKWTKLWHRHHHHHSEAKWSNLRFFVLFFFLGNVSRFEGTNWQQWVVNCKNHQPNVTHHLLWYQRSKPLNQLTQRIFIDNFCCNQVKQLENCVEILTKQLVCYCVWWFFSKYQFEKIKNERKTSIFIFLFVSVFVRSFWQGEKVQI